MARPLKLTDNVRTRLCQRLRAGAFADQAARSVGIGPSTYHEWMARGRKAIARGSTAKSERPFVQLVEEVTSAMADAEIEATTVLRVAMREDWRAAAWYLERRHPDRWRRRAAGEVDAGQDTEGTDQVAPVEVGADHTTQAAHDFLRFLRAA